MLPFRSLGPLFVLPLLASADRVFMSSTNHHIVVVSKRISNPFFAISGNGCLDSALKLGVTCTYTGPEEEDADEQVRLIGDLIDQEQVDGLAISVIDSDKITPVIKEAVSRNIAVVTFDSDAPQSLRSAYIGTNNTFMGERLGKVLKQLAPEGGTYAIVTDSSPNLQEREHGLRASLDTDKWTEITASPAFMKGNRTLAMVQIEEFASFEPTAIVPVMGAPMMSEGWKPFVNDHPEITFVVADGMPSQLELLAENYAGGLVAQLPYEMGYRSVEALFDLIQGKKIQQEFIGTNLLEHTNIPLVLPELVVDENLIGNLRCVGFILFGLVFFMAFIFATWVWIHRGVRIVRVAQPNFLLMLAVGVTFMAAAMIPLGLDDSSTFNDVTICMTTPWFAIFGFTVTISALFAKTYRVYRIFHTQSSVEHSTEFQVLKPFLVLMTANIVILTIWTTIDPLVYVRNDHDGTDGWNRIVSTYGSCQSENVAPYVAPLAILNVGVLVVGNWYAYETRMIKSEFSESKFIGLSMASMLQAALTGVPLLFVVRDSPQAFYLVTVFMIFCICCVILVLMFLPKIFFALDTKDLDPSEQNHLIQQQIQSSISAVQSHKETSTWLETSSMRRFSAEDRSKQFANEAEREVQVKDPDTTSLPTQDEDAPEEVINADCSYATYPTGEASKDVEACGRIRNSLHAGFNGDLERGRLSTISQSMNPGLKEDSYANGQHADADKDSTLLRFPAEVDRSIEITAEETEGKDSCELRIVEPADSQPEAIHAKSGGFGTIPEDKTLNVKY